jgi:hypothetical protein
MISKSNKLPSWLLVHSAFGAGSNAKTLCSTNSRRNAFTCADTRPVPGQ